MVGEWEGETQEEMSVGLLKENNNIYTGIGSENNSGETRLAEVQKPETVSWEFWSIGLTNALALSLLAILHKVRCAEDIPRSIQNLGWS